MNNSSVRLVPAGSLRKGRFPEQREGEDLPLIARMNTGDVKGGACLHLTSEAGHGKTKSCPDSSKLPLPPQSGIAGHYGVEAGITSCRSELGKSSFRAKANTAFQGVDGS